MKPTPILGRLTSVLLTALSACMSVGPDYRVPDAAIVNRPEANAGFVAGDAPVFAAEDPPANWWRLFRDARLDGLIEQALQANTDLRAAGANIARADAALRQAKAARLPGTQLEVAPAYGLLSAEQFLVPGPLPSLWLYDMGFEANWQIDLFGQIRRGIEASSADSDAARAARDVTRVTVAAETARAYAEACSAGHALAVAQHSIELQSQSAQLVQRFYQAGRGISLDVTRAVGQLDELQASLPTFEAERKLALYRLAVLIGRTPAEAPQDVAACVEEPQLPAVLPIGDGAQLLRRRPDIRQAERALAAATARIGMATADLYPKVQLGVSAGSTGVVPDLLHRNTLRYSIGPLISWEWPNRESARARIVAAQATAQLALARFDGTVLAALREAESALTVYALDLDRHEALVASRAKAAQAQQDAQRLYEAGREAYFPVLDAQRSLAAVDQTLAASDGRLVTDRINVFLALGGGWQDH